jgi:hypothetical protein
MTQMRAVQVKGDGQKATDLYLDQTERPILKEGWVLAKVRFRLLLCTPLERR